MDKPQIFRQNVSICSIGVNDAFRTVVIVIIATSAAAAASTLFWTLTDGASTSIVQLVTGSDKGSFQEIDKNLGLMQRIRHDNSVTSFPAHLTTELTTSSP